MSNPQGRDARVASAQTTGSQRGVKSTRTPSTRTARDAEPHRSQTVPVPTPAPASTTRRTPTSQTTIPVPSGRKRSTSAPRSQPSPGPRPEPPKPKNSLDGTDYIVEELSPTFRSESRQGGRVEPPLQSILQPSGPVQPLTRSESRQGGKERLPQVAPSPPTMQTQQSHSSRSDSRQGGREPAAQLAPPSSMPVPKANSDPRQSVSSFQTEPSSYYSAAEDADSAAGTPIPPPQMPQPEHEAQGSKYESLWLAAQAAEVPPPMPVPEVAHPPMPSADLGFEQFLDSPYDRENEGDYEDEHPGEISDESAADVTERLGAGGGQQDRYDSSWLAQPSPGMPIPASGHSRSSSHGSDPPMPAPNSGSHLGSRPGYGSARINSSQSGHGHGSSVASRPVGVIPSTAPLKIHHAPRPAGLRPPSPNIPSSSGPTPTQSTFSSNQPASQNSNYNQSTSPPRVSFQQQNVGSGFSTTSRPENERPPPSAVPSTTFPSHSSAHKPVSGYDSRPPGASAPSIPSGANPSATHYSHPAKPFAGQNIAPRPGRTHNQTSAASPSHTTPSTTPSAQPATAASATHAQPTPSPSSSSNQPSKPAQSSTVSPAYISSKPPISSNLAPQKTQTHVSNVQAKPSTATATATATTTARPQAQVLESTRPSVSAPQVQHQSSTASSAASKQQARVHEASAAVAAGPTRPRFNATVSQMDTQYVNMLLALDDIPALHNLLAGFFNWILLAGFILFPGTFNSLQNNSGTTGVTAQVQHQLVNAVSHVPLFVVAWVCTGIGAFGMIWLAWRWRKNYLWGLNKIFMPGFLNSLAGLLSTIANIFGVQHGELVTTSKITLIVTASSTGVLGILTAFYSLWMVKRVKARHDQEVGKERTGKYGEGVVDLSKRKVNGTR